MDKMDGQGKPVIQMAIPTRILFKKTDWQGEYRYHDGNVYSGDFVNGNFSQVNLL